MITNNSVNVFTLCLLFTSMPVSIRSEMEGFIVGGSFAPKNSHPHSAFLRIQCVHDRTAYYICGASVLNELIVLTAAHCVVLCRLGTSISINFGTEHKENVTVISAKRYAWHGWYDDYTMANDIGLVKLSRPVQLNSIVRRVAIMRDPPYTEPASVAGWGLFEENVRAKSLILKVLHKNIIKAAECERLIGRIAKGTFCASSKHRGNHFSQGDSGSALVVRGYIQIGIISGSRPSFDVHIGIYTDIGYFYDWIIRNAYDLYCDLI